MLKTTGKTNTAISIAVIIPTVYKDNFTDVIAAIESLMKTALQKQVRVSFLIFIDKAAPTANFTQIKKTIVKATGCNLQLAWSHTQVGFTGAINQSIFLTTAQNKFDWVLVFNDDAVAKPNFWDVSTRLIDQNQGIVSCGVEGWDGVIESFGLRQSDWGLTLPVKIKSTIKNSSKLFSGTCFFISGKTAKKLCDEFGFFFFPLFFAYAEDFELSIRLNRLGIPVSVDQVIRVKHKGSQTSGRGSSFQLFYGLRNDFFVHALHHSFSISFFWYVLRFLVYITLLSWYKGYVLLPLKILGSMYKNRSVIHFWRKQYDQKLPHSYSF